MRKFRDKRLQPNPPPRLRFEPPEIDDLLSECHVETLRHIDVPEGDFEVQEHEEMIENFIHYVQSAFISVPNELFELLLNELPSAGYYPWLDAWWMKDPIALQTAQAYPGNNYNPHMTVIVSAWDRFINSVWNNESEKAGAAPQGIQIACLRLQERSVGESNRNDEIEDELDSTGKWKSAKSLLRLPAGSAGIWRVMLYTEMDHPALDMFPADNDRSEWIVDQWGRGY